MNYFNIFCSSETDGLKKTWPGAVQEALKEVCLIVNIGTFRSIEK